MTQIIHDVQLDYDDVLIRPNRSIMPSRKLVNLEREFKFYNSPRTWHGVPICIANMSTCGVIKMANVAREYKIITCLHKYYDVEILIEHFSSLVDISYDWYSLGIQDNDIEKLTQFVSRTKIQPNLCIDVANGHMDSFVKKINIVREICPESIIMAGNVGLPEMIHELIHYGKADIVKCGIGPGSLCRTRAVTGVGVPQLSLCLDAANVAHGLKKENRRLALVCGDGGIKEIGDFAKCLGAGADFVMAGGVFMGFKENDGTWKEIENNGTVSLALKVFGMSSKAAQEKFGTFKDYRASEGDEKLVSCKGSIDLFLKEVLGGLRSTCTYVGATEIKDLAKCTTFIRTK